jgi:DNA mismatch endonuclease Vsr
MGENCTLYRRVLGARDADTGWPAEEKKIIKRKPFSEESKKKIGDALRGKPKSVEARRHMSEAKKGRYHPSEEQKQKVSAKLKGRPRPREVVERIAAGNRGKIISEEHKEILRGCLKGKPGRAAGCHHSEESRKRNSEANKGRKAWNKGIPCSEEVKKKQREAIRPPVSEETRKKLSDANSGEKHPLWGKHRSEETREKIRISKLNGPPMPKRDTSIELKLQWGLTDHGIDYKTHINVCNICQPDIIFPELKIAVFADGDHWHSKEFKGGKVWERDRKQESILKENGWIFIRFWEHEINKNPDYCINKIIMTVKEIQ